jgi:hypothetical protein
LFQWGLTDDVPIASGFDRDGKTDVAVWRNSTGEWWIRYSSDDLDPIDYGYFQFGSSGDVPLGRP